MYASTLLYILALFLSKISLLCLIWRLSVERTHVLLAQAGVAIASVVTVASFLMVALGCNFHAPWEQTVSLCDNLVSLSAANKPLSPANQGSSYAGL